MSTPGSNADLARTLFAAFASGDRATAEALLTDDFTFTSPYDDRIGRDVFFQRCWPAIAGLPKHHVEKVVERGADVFMLFHGVNDDGREFRNVNVLTIRNGRVRSLDVYFGAAYRDGALVRGEDA